MRIDRPVTSISLGDLQKLVDDEVREDRFIDYKRDEPCPPSPDDKKKLDFADDVSAFANGSGGTLIYGIEEKTIEGKPSGIPEKIVGIRGLVLDSKENQLRSTLDSKLDPRLPNHLLAFHAIDVGDNKSVLLIRVKKSHSGPHMVKRDSAFRIRDGQQNRQLDQRGIRSLMLEADWRTRFHNWRKTRVELIQSGGAPATLAKGVVALLHVVPVDRWNSSEAIDLQRARELAHGPTVAADDWLVGLDGGEGYSNFHFNVDGLIVRDVPDAEGCWGYLQLFRDCGLETVGTSFVHSPGVFNTASLEQRILKRIPRYLNFFSSLEVAGPIAVALTLLGVNGLAHEHQRDLDRARGMVPKFDRDVVYVPELTIEDSNAPPPQMLRPLIDTLWQAGGHSRSPNFKPDGTYRLGRVISDDE